MLADRTDRSVQSASGSDVATRIRGLQDRGADPKIPARGHDTDKDNGQDRDENSDCRSGPS